MLALAVHVFLAAALMLGVRWQSRAPDVVTVELWQPPSAPLARPEPPKVEAPKPAPPPPPPAKPEPRIDKPDIAVKAPPKPKPKPEPKPVPKPEPKPKPKPAPVVKPAPPPPPDDTMAQRLIAEALLREQQTFAAEREHLALKDQRARDAQSARERELNAYVAKIRAKIRGNFNVSPLIQGNPEAKFLVTQLPTGEIFDAKLVISSGNDIYDNDVLRAILKSSPLPKPDNPALFQRVLDLTFRLKE
jgi:colicin import membrane protein